MKENQCLDNMNRYDKTLNRPTEILRKCHPVELQQMINLKAEAACEFALLQANKGILIQEKMDK